MSNVLSTEKREQVVALGRLGWPLRRIEQTTGVRRETASAYLRAAGIPIRPPGSWGRRPAKPANEVTTDPDGVNGVVEGFVDFAHHNLALGGSLCRNVRKALAPVPAASGWELAR